MNENTEAKSTVEVEKPWHDGLRLKQRKFFEEYLVDLNGTKAAIRAGYNANDARSCASKLLKKHKAKLEKLFESCGVSHLRIIEEYAKIAFANISDYVKVVKDQFGTRIVITPSAELSEEQLAALAEISETVNEDGSVSIKVKPHDKLSALTWLGKASRLFVERAEISGPDGGPIQIDDAKMRLESIVEAVAKKLAAAADGNDGGKNE